MALRVPPSRSNPPSSSTPSPSVPNRVLGLVPPAEMTTIGQHLRRVVMNFDDVIYGYGDPIATIYFPESAVLSSTLTMEDGRTVEVGTIGNEGVGGLSAWVGRDPSPTTVICQIPGMAQAISVEALKREAATAPHFHDLLLRAMQSLAIQTMHSAACNGLHSVEERLARWLLMTHDRVQRHDMPLTQQFLAYMLGVYRPSVTVVARTFQTAGLIRYERGSVTILDREGLEAASCECYRVCREATDALIPPAEADGINLATRRLA